MLREMIQAYREPTTRMVGLVPNPPDHSCDNGLLFSATYMVLEGYRYLDDYNWFQGLLKSCEPVPGYFVRYPKADVVAHDDLTGIVAASPQAALRILAYGREFLWCWGLTPRTRSIRTWWGRIVDFPPTVMAASAQKIGLISQILWSIDTMASCLTEKGNTSGKCLSYLKVKVMNRRKYLITTLAIKFWKWRMMKTYPDGLRGVYAIYFGPSHPFTLCAPSNFD